MSRIVDTIRSGPRAEAEGAVHDASRARPARPAGDPELGMVQYIHLGDRDTAERVLTSLARLPVRHLRTSISWCDWTREGGEEWYRWLLPKLTERVSVLPCFLYTPPELGILPKTSSPPRDPAAYGEFVARVLQDFGEHFPYIELWNEPNNYIEWDWTVDPEWTLFAEMIGGAAERAAALGIKSVLGGMSPFDPNWLELMFSRGALEHVDVIGVHGFPGTWEAVWEGWDEHVGRVRDVVDLQGGEQRIWVTEAGFSTWAHDELRQLSTLVELLDAPADRVYWYSLEDLAPERETLDGFHCDERAYHFGLQHHGGRPKLLGRVLADRDVAGVRELVRFAGASGPRRLSSAGGGISRERVLITGGAGFIGCNLADRLAGEGAQVVVLDSLVRPGVESNARWLKRRHGARVELEVADVRDGFAIRRAIEGCGRVFHLAAQVAVTDSLLDPLVDHAVNVQGTLGLLEAARAQPEPPAIVFTSTNKVYGRLDDIELSDEDGRYLPASGALREHGVSEDRPLSFSSPYGCSKGAAEQYVLDYAHSYGLRTCVLRMSCIYGRHQQGTEDQGWVAHFMLAALRGEPITIFGNGKQTRDLLSVEDLLDVLTAASTDERALRGRAFNIGGGPDNVASVAGVVGLIAELTGRPPRLRFGDWRVADQRYYASDTRAFGELTGWQPRIGVAAGIARLHEWLASRRPEEPAELAPAAAGRP